MKVNYFLNLIFWAASIFSCPLALAFSSLDLANLNTSIVSSKKVWIPVEKDFSLKGEIFPPPGYSYENLIMEINSDNSFPVIIFLNPFGQGYEIYLKVARSFAARGFWVLLFNPRGWHGSDGTTTFDYNQVTKDISKVMDWLESILPISSKGFGVTGISEGGGLSLLAAANDQRIGAIAGLSSWSDLSHPSLGNTTRATWMGVLGGLALIFGDFVSMLREVRTYSGHHLSEDRVRERMRLMSPISHVDVYNTRQVPIYLSHNYDDYFFPVNQILEFYEKITGPKCLVVRPGFHAINEILGLNKDGNELWEDVYGWFDKFLIDINRPVKTGIRFSQKNEKKIIEIESSDDLSIDNVVYTMGIRSDGTPTLHSGSSQVYRKDPRLVLKAPFLHGGAVHTGIPLLSSYQLGEGKGPIQIDISRFKHPSTLALMTEPLDKGRTIYGVPRIHLSFWSAAPKGQVVAHLLDIAPDGKAYLITHGVWSWITAPPHGHHDYDMELYGVAWRVKTGHRLMLAFDTRDLEYWPTNWGSYELDFAKGSHDTTVLIPVLMF